jgi:hypothetical protein
VRLLALVATVAAAASPVQFLQEHQGIDGGFAEVGGRSSLSLTAWVALGLESRGEPAGQALDYLRAHEDDRMPATTRALVALAAAALGDPAPAARLPTGVGQTNAIIWTIIARRQAGLPVPAALVRALVARQVRSGGWSWAKGGAPDSNDTAAAVQALRAVGVSGASIRRALAYLTTTQQADGGFALLPGRSSDAQSTAWAIQGFLAAGKAVPRNALTYLRQLRRTDGSYALSKRYATTPVWVTAQVLPAVARRPFPLR